MVTTNERQIVGCTNISSLGMLNKCRLRNSNRETVKFKQLFLLFTFKIETTYFEITE